MFALREFSANDASVLEGEISELSDLFARAERSIKKHEKLCGELVIPAVNELRYAGWHLVKCYSCESNSKKIEHAVSAKRHCKRSIYDAIEATNLYFFFDIQKFLDDYRKVDLTIIPDLHDYLKKLREIQEFLPGEARVDNEKEQFYEQYAQFCDELRDIHSSLYAMRSEINKTISRSRKETRKFILTFMLGLFGVIISIVALFK